MMTSRTTSQSPVISMTSSKKKTLYIDIETYSDRDIKSAGAYKYIASKAFEIILLAYAWDDEPVEVLELSELQDTNNKVVVEILEALKDPSITKIAHNAVFERTALGKYAGGFLPVEAWADTMVLAAMHGLPLSLDAVGEALKLEAKKIKEGTLLINYFCKPCKATKSNGGRTRNYPEHDPDRWERFKSYCIRDVEVCREIYRRLSNFPIPAWEEEVRRVDDLINLRGVKVSTALAKAAVEMGEKEKEANLAEMARLTGLDNPNSVAQLKSWLEDEGYEVESLNKESIKELLSEDIPETVRRVLELRTLIGKTSNKKYQAMLDAAGDDDRVRGLLQYYGTRTGRWAGRLVQVQNLPQNHLDDIGVIRQLVLDGDLGLMHVLYANVPDVLSQLIRTAFVAEEGHKLLIADYSAIEARIVAYLAGEQWRLDTFAAGGDIYCQSASQMFHVPVEKHGINGHLRAKGKIAELACIAEGQQVLTDCGLVHIESVTESMKLWDGEEWVSHDGVVCKGIKEVWNYGGLEATPDHIVWAEINGSQRPIHFGDAATCGAHLVQTGAGRNPLRMGGNNQSGETVEQELESLLCTDGVQRVWVDSMAITGQPEKRQVEGVSELLTAEGSPNVAVQTLHSGKTALHEPEGWELSKLRSKGHTVQIPKCDRSMPLHDRDAGVTVKRPGTGQNRCERSLRAGESPLGDTSRELSEPAQISREVKVYDILNAGPRHRFTVSNVLVHNCGYGGGVGALKAFGADKMGLSESDMQEIVDQWRAASPTIPKLWSRIEKAANRALETPGRKIAVSRKKFDKERARANESTMGARSGSYSAYFNDGIVCTFYRDRDALRCVLPSGRILSYWSARIEDGSIVFMGQNQTTKKWEKTETWGGKLVENVVQAIARDCLAVAMVRLSDAGFKLVFSVHDEVIAEEPKDGRTWQDMAKIMSQPIDWAPGLVLPADGFETNFYMKD